jgi:nucleotide-binding universal stress UspA family protein
MSKLQTFSPLPHGVRWGEMTAYSRYIKRALDDLDQEWVEDLLLVSDSRPAWWQRWLRSPSLCRLIEESSRSVMIVRIPRWPIRHILMLVRGHKSDEVSLDWVERLAYADSALVSILPIIPALPRLHRIGNHVRPPSDVLLSPSTPSGTLLDHCVERLQQRQIPVRLALLNGDPDEEIRMEVNENDPDMVIIAAETEHRLVRLLCGELIHPLLRWLDRPLLIAKRS